MSCSEPLLSLKIGKKSGEERFFSPRDTNQPWLSAVSSFLFLFCFLSPAHAFLMPLPPSSWLGKILLASQSGSSAYWTAFTQLWVGSPVPRFNWGQTSNRSVNWAITKGHNGCQRGCPHNRDTTHARRHADTQTLLLLISHDIRMSKSFTGLLFRDPSVAFFSLILDSKQIASNWF